MDQTMMKLKVLRTAAAIELVLPIAAPSASFAQQFKGGKGGVAVGGGRGAPAARFSGGGAPQARFPPRGGQRRGGCGERTRPPGRVGGPPRLRNPPALASAAAPAPDLRAAPPPRLHASPDWAR